MKARRIMFAVPSPGGADPAALDKAVALASALEAELELFHCIYDVDIAHPGRFATRGAQADVQELVAQRHQQLEFNARRLRDRGVRVRSSVRWDQPAYAGIVRQVLRHKPDLLIAQSMRKEFAARLLLTQTDYKLIETCPCPVLFMKTRRPYSDPCVLAAVDPERAHGKPRGIDDAIVSYASTVTEALSGRLIVCHARVPFEERLRVDPALRRLPEIAGNDAQSAYRESTEGPVIDLASRYGVPRDRVRVVDGPASELLPRVAEWESADIVVMGAVSRSWLRKVFVGHTAERILDSLDSDVLVVKPPGFRTTVSRQSVHHIERSASRPARSIW